MPNPQTTLNTKFITDAGLNTTYEIKGELGKGAFATVYEVLMLNREESNKYALKAVDMSKLSQKSLKKLQTEIEIHKNIEHDNIVKLYRTFTVPNVELKIFEEENEKNFKIEKRPFTFFVMELCEVKSLNDHLKSQKRFSERLTKSLTKQLIYAVDYLHNNNIIHRDIKLSNIFLKDNKLKLGDFGLSAIVPINGRKTTVCGTPNYIAPEILKYNKENTKGHSFEVDAWSVGIVIYTMLVGKSPFSTTTAKEIYKRIKNSELRIPSSVSGKAQELLAKLLDKNPDTRLTLRQALNFEFFEAENALHSLLKRINEGRINIMQDINSLSTDFVLMSSRLRQDEVSVYMKCGAVGSYSVDHTSVYIVDRRNYTDTVQYKENKIENLDYKIFNPKKEVLIFYKSKSTENKKKIKKEVYEFVPEFLEQRVERLLSFRESFYENLEGKVDRNVKFSFITRIKKIDMGILFGLFNNNLVFDFVNGRCVVEKAGDIYVDGESAYDKMVRNLTNLNLQ